MATQSYSGNQRKLDPRLNYVLEMSRDLKNLAVASEMGDIVASETQPLTTETATRGVLVELADESAAENLDALGMRHIVGNIYTADIPVSQIENVANLAGVKSVEASRTWYPMLNTSLSETRADVVQIGTGGTPRTGRNVCVGIIDLGFDFTMDDFRDSSGNTRVAFMWDQTLSPQAGEAAPPDFGYGVEYSAVEIDNALSQADPFAHVRHLPGIAAHGTHVAGTAAGNGKSADANFPVDQFVGAAPEATIIFVQPRSSQSFGQSFTDSHNVADAVAYVFARANQLGMPCVINMSLGQNGGSHDGESVVERAIDRLLEENGRAFVSAGGNEHIWRGHASGQLAAGDTRILHWKTGGGMPIPSGGFTGTGIDRTPSEMEIWYSSRDRFRVSVIAPDGSETQPVSPGESNFEDIDSTSVFILSDRFTVFNGDARVFIHLAPQSAGQSVASGTWRVRIEALDSVDGDFDAWIERDARDVDNNFADQSFFLGGDFDPVRTLGTPATTRRGVAVANYDHRTLAPNDSSGRGPTRSGLLKPEVAAPGSAILASCSMGGRLDSTGNTIPMRVDMTGTSMAAPHVAGIIALLLEEEPGLSAPQITSILTATADNPNGTTDYDPAWGMGRVNAQRAMALLGNPNQPGLGSGTI